MKLLNGAIARVPEPNVQKVRRTFETAKQWYEHLKQKYPFNSVIVLVINVNKSGSHPFKAELLYEDPLTNGLNHDTTELRSINSLVDLFYRKHHRVGMLINRKLVVILCDSDEPLTQKIRTDIKINCTLLLGIADIDILVMN